jgi:hypothetical protein
MTSGKVAWRKRLSPPPAWIAPGLVVGDAVEGRRRRDDVPGERLTVSSPAPAGGALAVLAVEKPGAGRLRLSRFPDARPGPGHASRRIRAGKDGEALA